MCSRLCYWQVKGSLSNEAACLNRRKFSFKSYILQLYYLYMCTYIFLLALYYAPFDHSVPPTGPLSCSWLTSDCKKMKWTKWKSTWPNNQEVSDFCAYIFTETCPCHNTYQSVALNWRTMLWVERAQQMDSISCAEVSM